MTSMTMTVTRPPNTPQSVLVSELGSPATPQPHLCEPSYFLSNEPFSLKSLDLVSVPCTTLCSFSSENPGVGIKDDIH